MQEDDSDRKSVNPEGFNTSLKVVANPQVGGISFKEGVAMNQQQKSSSRSDGRSGGVRKCHAGEINEALVEVGVYTKQNLAQGVCDVEEVAVDVTELTEVQVDKLVGVGGVVENGFVVFGQ